MPDLADLYPGFAAQWIDTAAGRIFARSGGEGPPLLLLHGYPQTNVMWHRVAPGLAEAGHRVVCPDLRGYGSSHAPPAGDQAVNYAKRAMAAELVEVEGDHFVLIDPDSDAWATTLAHLATLA